MSRKIVYSCDHCNKDLEIGERLHFEVSIRQNYKMNVIKKFDLCKECAGETLGSMIGFDKIQEINDFTPIKREN